MMRRSVSGGGRTVPTRATQSAFQRPPIESANPATVSSFGLLLCGSGGGGFFGVRTQARSFFPGLPGGLGDIGSLVASPAGMMALIYRPSSSSKGQQNDEEAKKNGGGGGGAGGGGGGGGDDTSSDRKENKNSSKKEGGDSAGGFASWIPGDGLAIAGAILLVTTLWEILRSQQAKVSRWMGEYFYTTLEVRSHQEEFDMVMHWVSTQELSQKTKNLGFHTTHVMEDDDLIVEDIEVAKKQHQKQQGGDGGSSTTVRDDDAVTPSSSSAIGVDFLRVGSSDTPAPKQTRLVPGYGTHLLRYKGRKMYITRELDSEQPQSAKGGDTFGRRMPAEVITITCFSTNRAIVEELIEDVKKSRKEKDARSTPIYLKASYGADWDLLCRRPKRPLDTLFLPANVTRIVPEIENFLKVREDYGRVGVPWRRGFLLTGPPGTGKSSLIMAIAGKFNLPLYNLSLRAGGGEGGSGGMSDTDLLKLVNSVPPRSILLIEDMDTVLEDIGGNSNSNGGSHTSEVDYLSSSVSCSPSSPSMLSRWSFGLLGGRSSNEAYGSLAEFTNHHTNDDNGGGGSTGGISMSGLLNALDGVACSEGRILFITANDPKKFKNKDVLLRPGRVDRTVEFDKMKPAQWKEMMEKYRTSLPNIYGLEAQMNLELAKMDSNNGNGGDSSDREDEMDLGTTAAQLQGRLLDQLVAPTPEQLAC